MKLLHVTIQTSRFEEEIAFYREIAGLSIERDMRPAGRSMVFLSDAAGDTCIEIIGAPGAAACNAPDLSIGFKTEDAPALRERLLGLGLECTPMIEPGPGVRFFFTKDPAGLRVQFMG